MKVRIRANNDSAVLCHVINYQQFTVEHGKYQSLDRKLAKSSVETFCYTFCRKFTLTRFPNII